MTHDQEAKQHIPCVLIFAKLLYLECIFFNVCAFSLFVFWYLQRFLIGASFLFIFHLLKCFCFIFKLNEIEFECTSWRRNSACQEKQNIQLIDRYAENKTGLCSPHFQMLSHCLIVIMTWHL